MRNQSNNGNVFVSLKRDYTLPVLGLNSCLDQLLILEIFLFHTEELKKTSYLI